MKIPRASRLACASSNKLRSVLVAATVVKKSLEISVHYFANPRVRQNVAGLCDRWVSIPIILTSFRSGCDALGKTNSRWPEL